MIFNYFLHKFIHKSGNIYQKHKEFGEIKFKFPLLKPISVEHNYLVKINDGRNEDWRKLHKGNRVQLQVDPRRDDIKVLKRKKLLGRLDIDGRIRIFNKMTNSEALFVARVNSCWFPSKRTLAIHEFDLAMLKRIITGLVELYELGHPDISTGTLFFSQRAMHYLEEYLYGKGYHELWRQIIENRDLHAIKTGQYKILL